VSTKSIRLMSVVSVSDGTAHFQDMLVELNDLFFAESQELEVDGIAYSKRTAIQQKALFLSGRRAQVTSRLDRIKGGSMLSTFCRFAQLSHYTQ